MVKECATKAASPSWSEQDRLAALCGYTILDTEPEIAFDDIARIAAQVCRAPMALVSLVDDRRQWFKSEIGLGVRETPLSFSICAHAILQKGLFVVPDTTKDPRFVNNPLVTGEPHLRFYAGALLETVDGLPLGTMCVLDYEARPQGVTPEQADTLSALARSVMRELELRRANRILAEKTTLLDSTLESMDQGILMVDGAGHVAVCNERATKLLGLPPDLMRGKPHFSSVKRWQVEQNEFVCVPEALKRQIEGSTMECDPPCYERARPDGTVLEIRTIRLPGGGLVRTYTDITARKRSEEAVAQSEERYRALAEATASVVWRADAHGRSLHTSVAPPFTSCSIENHLGLGWLDFVHPDDRTTAVSSWKQAIETRVMLTNVERKLADDGSYRWVQVRAVPLKNRDGSIREWVGTTTDIHERYLADQRLRESEERYRLASLATADAIYDFDLVTGDLKWAEGALLSFGYRDQEIEPTEAWWLERVHPDDRQRAGESLRRFLAGDDGRWLEEYRFRQGDGTYAHVFERGFVVRDQGGKAMRMVGAMQDVSDRMRSEGALRASEERLRIALQAGRMFAWERDLSTGWVERSENAHDLIGIGSGPLSQFLDNILPDDRSRAGAIVRGEVENDQQCSELRYVHPNGTVLWLTARSTALQEQGKPDRLIGVTFDITERKAAEDELRRMANQDPLTGLGNRTFLQTRLAAALEDAHTSGTAVSLLLLDLDDFKAVNDTLGHDAGDALLTEVGRRLSALVPKGDTVARLGGDEFAILLPSMCLGGAARFAERLAERLRGVFEYGGRALSTKASIGVAAFPEHHRDPIELMKDADLALYRAKAEGRGRALVYTEAARAVMEQRVQVVTEVRDGLEADQFVPFYQPKVCYKTGRIVGFEALARWQHPRQGVLTPGYFGAAFADAEIAIAMGERMIRHVVRDIRSWLDQGLDCGRVAVNFSSAEFADPYLARHVLRVLAEAGVPTSHFEVEVTETVFLERSTETASAILQEFNEAGVSVALDDFGTGFASLTHLKRYPVDHIKVDRSFVRDLEVDKDDAAIVSAVIGLGRSLGMQVTAEGVETAGQAQRLTEMGCDFGQGYLYAKPMIGSRVPWLLTTWRSQPGREVRCIA